MNVTLPESSTSQTIKSPTGTLPQYGFGSDVAFDSLVHDNPFLFRIHTPRDTSEHLRNNDSYFIGQKFDARYSRNSDKLPESPTKLSASMASSTYDDAAQHMDWMMRHASPFVSASFSFIWAVWEATRRYKVGVKHDVEIAVIDARQLAGRAVTALELLRKSTPKE